MFKIIIQWIVAHWAAVAGVIIGVYEAIVRFIPTVGNWSILSKIIKFLKWLSDLLDRKK